METVLLATLIPIGYIVMSLTIARVWFRKYPWTKKPYGSGDDYSSLNEKIGFSAVTGFFWPLVVPACLISMGVKKYVLAPSRAERHAAKSSLTSKQLSGRH
jgi:hypothetical protein